MNLGTFKKQPVERLDYDIEYEEFLGTDTLIVSAPYPEVVFEPAGELNVDVTAIMASGKRLKLWIVDGVDGTTYKVTVTVRTAAGRVKQDEFRVRVKDE